MSGRRTEDVSKAENRIRGRVDRKRLRKMSEEEIRATSPEELAALPSDFWDKAEIVAPPRKEAISIRIDQDVLEWFRSQGSGYQTRMNAVLRSYMAAQQGRRG